jgi:hypothetical protein
MRISEDRYARDLRRIQLARRLVQYEVRTRWICAWTGLSGNQVRNLFRSYLGGARRRRGPSHRRVSTLLTSHALGDEASAAGGLAYALGAIGEGVPASGKHVPHSLDRGERLCDAFDLYREVMPDAHLSLDQLIILVNALTKGEDLEVGCCMECSGTLIVDRLSTARRVCLACKEHRPFRGKPQSAEQSVSRTAWDLATPAAVQLVLDL